MRMNLSFLIYSTQILGLPVRFFIENPELFNNNIDEFRKLSKKVHNAYLYKDNDPNIINYQIFCSDNLCINYFYGNSSGIFEIMDILRCCANYFVVIYDDHDYNMRRRELFFEIYDHISELYVQFNFCICNNDNWELVTSGHSLYVDFAESFINRYCYDEKIEYILYKRYNCEKWNYAIIHRTAIIKGCFTWDGCVVLGPETQIGYSVGLGNGVVIAKNSIIGSNTVIQCYTLVGYSTFICEGFYIGDRCIIGNNVFVVRKQITNADVQNGDLNFNQSSKDRYRLDYLDRCNILLSGTQWEASGYHPHYSTTYGNSASS